MREPIHPGETLREDLDALGMTAPELARRIQVHVNRITKILNGRRSVTGDTLRLWRCFGTSGEFWLNVQKLSEVGFWERENGAAIARLPTLAPPEPCTRRADARPPANFERQRDEAVTQAPGRGACCSAPTPLLRPSLSGPFRLCTRNRSRLATSTASTLQNNGRMSANRCLRH